MILFRLVEHGGDSLTSGPNVEFILDFIIIFAKPKRYNHQPLIMRIQVTVTVQIPNNLFAMNRNLLELRFIHA